MRREQKLWKDENWDLKEEMFKRIKVKQEEIRRKKNENMKWIKQIKLFMKGTRKQKEWIKLRQVK